MKCNKSRVGRCLVALFVITVMLAFAGCSGGDILSVDGGGGDKATETEPQSAQSEAPKAETPAQASDEGGASTEPAAEKPATSGGATSATGLRVKPDGKLKIAYMVDGLFNDSSQRHWQQVQNECEARGWELVSDTNVSGNYEADPTRNAFINMMNQDPDAIVISYLDIPPIADLCVEAHNKGIGVYCVGTDLSEGIMLNVLSENTVIGAKVMSYAMQRLNGSADTVGFMDLWMTRGIRRDVVAAAIAEDAGYDVQETVHHAVTPDGFTDEMFNVATNWLQKYGDKMDFIWACWDGGGITLAQAMVAAGYTADDMFTVGMDGGTQAWAYIRSGEIPFVASLAEPFEYQVHICFEGIEQLQVQGMSPGDKGCIVPESGSYSTDGMTVMVDKTNVPEVGSNIHALFNYYGGDPEDPEAWYNKGNIYKVAEYSGEDQG